jgi:hypothetical protein
MLPETVLLRGLLMFALVVSLAQLLLAVVATHVLVILLGTGLQLGEQMLR